MKDLQQTFEYLKQFLTEERLQKIEHFAPESSDFVLPVVEDVYQFRNAAAIVRSVEACGFHKVVALQEEYSFEPNLRVTKGADTWVEVEKMPRSMESFQNIKDRGYKIVAVSLENNAKMLNTKLQNPLLWFSEQKWKVFLRKFWILQMKRWLFRCMVLQEVLMFP
jgi:tRNA (guanosine-2'-O-)-methyltransferase